MWYGHSYSHKTIRHKTPESKQHALYRQQSEQHRQTIEVGGDILLRFKHGIGLRTGLAYTVVMEDFILPNFYYAPSNAEGRSGAESGLELDRSSGHSTFMQAQTQIAAQPDPQSNSGLIWDKVDNRHEMLDIPLVVNYELGGKWLCLQLESGAYINLYSSVEGGMRSSLGKPALLSSRNYPFRKNIGIMPYVGMSINLKMNANSSLLVGGHYRHTAWSITQRDHGLRQHMGTGGLTVGLRYGINR
jgi:hypothetical protein